MRFSFTILIFLLLTGCKSTDNATSTTQDAPTVPGKSTAPAPRPIASPFTVLGASVEGDSLKVQLQFGGGFRTHTFTLVSDGVATKSLPRQQPLKLLHDAQGDMGRALIQEQRSFDLTPFRDPSQPKIRLTLDGWPDFLDYTYTP
jgi:hypothetical protein